MEIDIDLSGLVIDSPKAKAEQNKYASAIEDILRIDEAPNTVIDCVNIYDSCNVPFFYAGDKIDMLNCLQTHSVDIAIYELTENFIDEFRALNEILLYKSVMYVYDKNGLHNSKIESFLYRMGYKVTGELELLGSNVFEYTKGFEQSFKHCFGTYFTADVFSILFTSAMEFDSIVYCDCIDLCELVYHGHKNDKNIFMAMNLKDAKTFEDMIDRKENEAASASKINQDFQFELF
jgi:hypothetical protein